MISIIKSKSIKPVPSASGVGKTTRIGVWGAYLYLLLPFILFAMGWMKNWIAIPMVIILLFCYYMMVRHAPALWRPEFTRDNIEKMLLIFVMICIWVYMSGIGKLVFQNTDHTARNAIFDILVQYDWPIIGTDGNGNTTSLIYYIGYWIPSAAVGKVFGLHAGYLMQVVWAILGVSLVYYFICARTKKLEVWPLVVMIFFSGLDIIGEYLIGTNMSTMSSALHLEWWNDPYQISSLTTQLFWVFNQCIPAWLATVLVMNLKDNKSIVIVWATTMLTSTIPFVGLLPIVAYVVFTRKYESKGKARLVEFWKGIFTVENVIGGGIVGITSFLYLRGNLSGSILTTSGKAIKPKGYDGTLMMWLMCTILEVGIYLLLIYRKERNNKLYYLIAVELCFFPLIRVGTSNDFCMRAVIPAQIILLMYIIDLLRETARQKKKLLFTATVAVLCIGSITPIHEFTRTVSETVERQRWGKAVEAEADDETDILKGGNFAGIVDDDIFYQWFVK